MKDLLRRARAVVTTSNMKISRRRLADYTSKHCTKFFIQLIKSLICGVVVDVIKSQIPYFKKDLLLCVDVVAITFNLEISRCHLANYIKHLY